jgi:hypothetical protein
MLFHRQLFSSNSHWCAFFISRNQSIRRLISFQKHDEKTTVFRDHCFQEFGPSTVRLTGTELIPILDVARQPMWRNVRCRHRSCVDTWIFATIFKKYSLFFPISSETLRFDTATVAANGQSRNVTKRF